VPCREYVTVINIHEGTGSSGKGHVIEERHAARAGSPSRGDLVAAAERLLQDEGIDALTIRRVATEVDASRQVVYSRFGDKAGLLRALHDEGFHRMAASMDALDEPPGTDAHILALGFAYRRTAHDAPALFDLMFGPTGPAFVPDASAQAVAKASFTTIIRGARAWLEANGGASDEAVSLAHALWAATHGVVSLERTGHLTHRAAQRELRALLRRVLHGSLAGSRS
jgi:AcrR family transcriptional regulator